MFVLNCPYTYDSSLSEDLIKTVLSSDPFQLWLSELDSDVELHNIHFQSVDRFGPRIGFVKFKADVSVKGVKVPGIVFCRGPAVAIFIILECEGKEYVLLVEQARIPVGKSKVLEIPAGMIDERGVFKGTAAQEVQEETGIVINEEHLVDLYETVSNSRGASFPGLYPSPGGCDEYIKLFLYKKHISSQDFSDLNGRLAGLQDHGEVITVKLVPLEDVVYVTNDAKALSALLLYKYI
ncbi:hypothetical protein RCL1_005780 [Eukaryota sp. TZLM3-RCL]